MKENLKEWHIILLINIRLFPIKHKSTSTYLHISKKYINIIIKNVKRKNNKLIINLLKSYLSYSLVAKKAVMNKKTLTGF